MNARSMFRRFTYHQPVAELRGTVHGLREVRLDGKPVGLINPTRDGYVVRDLEGRKLETSYGVSRDVAASYFHVDPDTFNHRHADDCTCPVCTDTGTVTCDECGKEHVAEFSHIGGYDHPVRVYAVICDTDNPQLLTDYYTEEVVSHA